MEVAATDEPPRRPRMRRPRLSRAPARPWTYVTLGADS